MMTHRQRAIAALEGRQPDNVPTFELVFHETERDFQGRTFYGGPGPLDATKVPYEESIRHNAQLYVDIARRFDHSIILLAASAFETWPDFWQANIDQTRAIREISGDEFMVLAHGDCTYAIPNGGDMMDFVMRIAQDFDGVKAEAEQRLRDQIALSRRLMAGGIDGFALCSDYSFNNGPFLSPDMFSELVTPYLVELCGELRAMGAYVIKHTDGNIDPILDQLVSAKPHALHSIDPMAGMDIRKVKEQYGRDVALCGNVHCAHLQTGTPEQIRESAEYAMTWGKPGGGFIFCTSNCVFRGMPLASYDLIQEIWRAGRDYS